MKTIYVVRHGECEGNLEQAFIGDMESPLTELGHEQAHEFAEKLLSDLDGKIPTAFISSRLSRAINTSKVAMERIENADGVEYYYYPSMEDGFGSSSLFYTEDDMLKPRSYGEIKGRDYHDPKLQLSEAQVEELRHDFTSPFPGVEDDELMSRRANAFKDHLLNLMDDGDTVVVACHKSNGRFLVHALTGEDDYLDLFHENCEFKKIEI